MTPRKPKPRQQPHRPTSFVQASDYESDVLNYNHTHVPPATRTNTELNLSVLRRHNNAVRTILSIAANAVIYVFSPTLQSWEKSGVEGTLFVCEQESREAMGEAGYCMIVLNRRGLDNLILDLGHVEDVEVTSELLIIRFKEMAGSEYVPKVMGIWIHADTDDTREVNADLIKQCWEQVTLSKQQYSEMAKVETNTGNGVFANNGSSITQETVNTGRRISLTDLFRQQNSQ